MIMQINHQLGTLKSANVKVMHGPNGFASFRWLSFHKVNLRTALVVKYSLIRFSQYGNVSFCSYLSTVSKEDT